MFMIVHSERSGYDAISSVHASPREVQHIRISGSSASESLNALFEVRKI